LHGRLPRLRHLFQQKDEEDLLQTYPLFQKLLTLNCFRKNRILPSSNPNSNLPPPNNSESKMSED
jgi:hypothetical protein